MSLRARLLLVGAGASLAALLPTIADAPFDREASAAAGRDRTAVRIAHEIVPATLVQDASGRGSFASNQPTAPPAAGPPAAAAPPSRVRRVVQSHTQPDGFVSRARQLIVGNGRYKPEPFPRVEEPR